MATSEDDRVRIRIAEIMSSAGVGYNQISLEILYLLPREFVDRYIEVWEKAMGPGVRAPGDAMARDGELGKAQPKSGTKGKMVGAGAGGGGKRWARIFTVRSEEALNLKGRMDKRLRNMARDMRDGLRDIEDDIARGYGKNGAGRSKALAEGSLGDSRRPSPSMHQCGKCGRLYPLNHNFCSFDGTGLRTIEGNGKRADDK